MAKEKHWLETMPIIEIVDLSHLSRFSNAYSLRIFLEAVGGSQLPTYFPNIPDFAKAELNGIFITPAYKDDLLTIPAKLLDSDIFNRDADELRGILEEVIIHYSDERKKHGLNGLVATGNYWSTHFYERLGTQDKVSNTSNPICLRKGVNYFTPPAYKLPSVNRRYSSQGYLVVKGKVIKEKGCE
jgi:hypothetical protein